MQIVSDMICGSLDILIYGLEYLSSCAHAAWNVSEINTEIKQSVF